MRQYSKYLYQEKIGEKKVNSKYNNESWMEPVYKSKRMKIRILSDLHIDVNYKYPLELKDKDTFTVIAGDISGYPEYRDEWLKNNIHNGVFVEGNHIFYNDEGKSLQKLYNELEEKYPLESNVSFLQNQYKIINNVVFVGCTLWTDCRIYGKKYILDLPRRMNDYRFGKYDENGDTRTFTPEDSINEFNNSLKYIEEICDQYPQYKIVVVTHHCPSIKCISSHYRVGDCNQAYASDLESFIKNHNNIVCWVCGHSHNSCDFKIDGCRVIMNCRGYVMYGENFRFDSNKKIYI